MNNFFINSLKHFIRLKRKLLSDLNSYFIIGKDSKFDANSSLIIRDKSLARPYINIGNDCLIEGSFVFENKNGVMRIGDRTFIGGGTRFICINNIDVGNDVMFSWGCTIIDNDAHSINWSERKDDVLIAKKSVGATNPNNNKNWDVVKSEPIIIKNKAWIGFNVIILKGVIIGEGAVVGAGSVVANDVPDYTVVAGNPAKVVKTLEKP